MTVARTANGDGRKVGCLFSDEIFVGRRAVGNGRVVGRVTSGLSRCHLGCVQLFKETVATLKRLKEQEDTLRVQRESESDGDGSEDALAGDSASEGSARLPSLRPPHRAKCNALAGRHPRFLRNA